jgi:hypothetical protein
MKNYNNGKIYKIEPTCEHDVGDIYIGSTNLQYLCQRMALHKYKYGKWKKELHHKIMCFDIFEKYGTDNVKISLIELVNANSKEELLEREAFYIRTLKCVNKCIPLRTDKQYYQDNKEKSKITCKEYRNKNKDKIKEYREKNKDKQKEYMKEYNKQYYEENKEKISEQNKQYYANQKLKKTMEI